MFKLSLFSKVMLILIGVVITYSLIIVSFVIPKVNNNIQMLQEKNAKEVLDKISTITKNVHLDLKNYKEDSLEKHKKRLVSVMDTLSSTLDSLSKSEQYDQKKFGLKATEIIKKTRYDTDGYFWINDFEPKMIMHPFTPSLDGKSLKDFKDPNGVYLFNEMVSTVQKNQNGFVYYSWPKPDEVKPQPKISYVKLFKKFNWIIGTGVYIDDIQKEINLRKDKLKIQLNKIVAKTQIGKTGYSFIFNHDGDIVAHPNDNMKGVNLKKVPFPNSNKTFFEKLIQASNNKNVYLSYNWDKPNDKGNYIYKKIAWVEYVPELDWYIGSTIYLDDFEELSKETISFIIMISFATLILAILGSFFFFRHLLKPIKDLSTFSSQVTKGDYSIRSIIKRDDEIGKLSSDFNTMVDTIEHHIDNLKQNVQTEVDKNRKNELQLLEQSKMASMGDMIGNIAHQWRQPLSVISTASTGIIFKKKMNLLKDDEIESMCNHINENAQYLSKTIDTFMDFLKEKKELQEVIIQERVNKALDIVKTSLINHHIKLINTIDDVEPIKVKLILGELSQVIINIINNAKDVLIDENIQNGWVKVELEKFDDKVIITIQDNGGGIPEDVLPRIFEPYFTTKHKSQGTGLGLHMSYQIITESLNGKLYVKNSENGAKFFIELPLEL